MHTAISLAHHVAIGFVSYEFVVSICAGVPWVCAGIPWVCAGVPWVCAGVPWVCNIFALVLERGLNLRKRAFPRSLPLLTYGEIEFGNQRITA
eukprot:271900-Prorocentrum_minimum.AAC.1